MSDELNRYIESIEKERDRLKAERDEALAELRNQRELWRLTLEILDELDGRTFKVPFSAVHRPIEKIEAVLAKHEGKP